MIEMGFVVALGLAVMYAKLGLRGRLWINSNPLVMDLIVFVGLNWLHWGTFSGIMVAAVGALFCSMFISLTRKWFGHIENGQYVRGWVDLSQRK
jgi:hypothetical protein